MKVNLFVPGMPKCGSYYLYDLLNQHPEINMCQVKEPAYFTEKINAKEYESKFSDNYYKYYGEATVEYLIDKRALNKIKRDVENPKFIILLRHPVKRAISHYFHRVNGGVDNTRLSHLLKDSQSYPIDYSNYQKHLTIFFKIFDKRQTLIIISEDLFNDPVLVYNKILQFLDLVPHCLDLELKKANQNKGKISKSLKLSFHLRKLSRNNKLKKKLGALLPLFRLTRMKLENLNTTNIRQKDFIHDKYYSNMVSILKNDVIYVRNLLNRNDLWEDLT